MTNLAPCAEPPFTLLAVNLGSDAPRWEVLSSQSPHQLCLHLCIPVTCQIRDCRGAVYTGDALVETDVALRLTMPISECWRNTMVVLPCVRLVCPPPPCDTPCFEAQLELLVEVYMTRWETCMAGIPKAVSST